MLAGPSLNCEVGRHPPVGHLNVAAAIEQAIAERRAKSALIRKRELLGGVGDGRRIRRDVGVRDERASDLGHALAQPRPKQQVVDAAVPHAASHRSRPQPLAQSSQPSPSSSQMGCGWAGSPAASIAGEATGSGAARSRRPIQGPRSIGSLRWRSCDSGPTARADDPQPRRPRLT